MKQIFSVIIFFLWTSANACDCKFIKDLDKAQSQEYKWNSLIFVGSVEQLNDDGTYSFKVIETLKGEAQDSIIYGKPNGYCYQTPQKWDYFWLIYVNPDEDGTITIGSCGLSRSFFMPYLFSEVAKVPPPPPPFHSINDHTMAQLQSGVEELKYKKKALDVLQREIEQLRKWRDE